LQLLDDQAHVIVANELALPSATGKLAGVAGSLHDAIEGEELLNDDWSHMRLSSRRG
jgi:hypothetical protein